MPASKDSFSTRRSLRLGSAEYHYYSLPAFAEAAGFSLQRLPVALRIVLENLLRHEDGESVTRDHLLRVANWDPKAEPDTEIAFRPARVVLQDFTGVPAVVDLCAMRDAMLELGGDPRKINPWLPSELVIDHSVQVDAFGDAKALGLNAKLEFERNRERYQLLRWAQGGFDSFRVVPPATGIVHQVNLEYLARVVFESEGLVYPDTLVGTDSHTTMINGLGVLGWGVGGIEAEAAMLGQAVSLLLPQVVGVRLSGSLSPAATATDVVLAVTERLRQVGVVGRFVEFFGPGLGALSLADRATLANMSPEFGSTCALFPIDAQTLAYLKLSGRPESQINRVEAYAHAQQLMGEAADEVEYSRVVEVDLGAVVPSIAGPKRPQDRIALSSAKEAWRKLLAERKPGPPPAAAKGGASGLTHGAVVIAAITSCTNTSNPSVMVAAGLLARAARSRGLEVKPWVKTSLAPGSQVVTEYLSEAGLLEDLEALRFFTVGYGCTTCIGNSGPLPEEVETQVRRDDLVVAAVLSGNRNFEGRIHSSVIANYLASPPLVVAYALAGTVDIDFETEALGTDSKGRPVYLRELWPAPEEVSRVVSKTVTPDLFRKKYADVFSGTEAWKALPPPKAERFEWDPDSTYVRKPHFFENLSPQPAPLQDIVSARVLLLLGDSVTTDHISPAGAIAPDGPAADYLRERGVAPRDFNSFGSRRGNHEVMVRGTFANVRLRNRLAPGTEGGLTQMVPSGQQTTVFEAAEQYRQRGTPLVVLAGQDYGTGSSRDWAAKGTVMLGVRAVIAESFERIHRSNLVGMGVLPLQFVDGSVQSLGLTGREEYTIGGISAGLEPGKVLEVSAKAGDGKLTAFAVRVRIDTAGELDFYRHGGILQFVLRRLVAAPAAEAAPRPETRGS